MKYIVTLKNDSMIDYRKIDFGNTDAQTESQNNPKLLIEGYYDLENWTERLLNGSTFLVLGYKGSGKTALSEHLYLKSQKDDNIVVEKISLKDLAYNSIVKIVPSNEEKEIKAKVAWRWLLLVKSLFSLINDNDAVSDRTSDINETSRLFGQCGLFPVKNLNSLIKVTSSNKFKAEIKNIGYEHTQTKENALYNLELLIDYIKELILSYREEHQHYIVIDGLDDILTSREIQYTVITALINEVRDLNHLFSSNSLSIKIIVLCRTDIFERLNDPNKNKIKQDNSLTFDWYQEGLEDQTNCGLIKIANRRTNIVFSDVDDMFSTFFPPKYNNKDVRSSLLDMTRHTPRDFLQLLKKIQNNCQQEKVSIKNIDSGIKEYSCYYFLSEINDELVGYIPSKYIECLFQFLSSYHKRELDYVDLKRDFSEYEISQCGKDLDEILKTLYECSAIGNEYKYSNNGGMRITFKYRNRTSTFNPKHKIILHKGLWKALNLNY